MSDHPASSHLKVDFEAALQDYERQTGIALAKHPLAEHLQECRSIKSITAALHEQLQAFNEFRGNEKVMNILKNVVSVLYKLSACAKLGEVIRMVHLKALIRSSIRLTLIHRSFRLQRQYTLHSLSYSPYLFFFRSTVAHLCNIQLYQVIKDVKSSYDALVELLESIEHLLYRLNICTKITFTVVMTEILFKILVELLFTLALATKKVRQGKLSESVFTVVLYIT